METGVEETKEGEREDVKRRKARERRKEWESRSENAGRERKSEEMAGKKRR
jgi:hypothetical protein